MKAARNSILDGLGELVGQEQSLHSFHGAVLRAAHSVRPIVESGAVLATCADEFNGEIRNSFHREVACLLTAPDIPTRRRIFSVANLGGRIEPGAISLANLHFTARSAEAGEKLLLIEISSHVGRRETSEGTRWGELDRFGLSSACCGALRLLLDAPKAAQSVRYPWFDQLTAFFGPERLAWLRADSSPHSMLRAACVHAVLQAETAMVDLLREPPTTPTHVLLVTLVVVNRPGPDNCIPVGVHHLYFDGAHATIEHGSSLRSTPSSMQIDESRKLVRVTSPFEEDAAPGPAVAGTTGTRVEELWRTLREVELRPQAAAPEVQQLVESTRTQLEHMHAHPQGARFYARPVLRAFLQGLSVVAPEIGVAALAFETARGFQHARRLEQLAAEGPSSDEARRALHDIEPSLQQLGHREAREVLEVLLSRQHPLLGK